MKPIDLAVSGHFNQSPQEICAQILDTDRWSEFKGYLILPGIESAHFESRTPTVVGSNIRVRNTDGTSHAEEIIEWDPTSRIAFRFHDFSPPLQHFATHFVETWEFHQSGEVTEATRRMALHPKGFPGWLILMPISILMKKAFEKDLAERTRG